MRGISFMPCLSTQCRFLRSTLYALTLTHLLSVPMFVHIHHSLGWLLAFVTLKREHFCGALDPLWFTLSIATLSGCAMEQILTKEEPLLSCVLH